jgi:hypothetical protein
MSDARLTAMRDLIQGDVGGRGLRTDPNDNLITACPDDFAAACRSIAFHPAPSVCIVTGFFIPHGNPPACETDGPLGAVFLARALSRLNVPVLILADRTLEPALEAGLGTVGLDEGSTVATAYLDHPPGDLDGIKSLLFGKTLPYSHLVALERVGPSHTASSLQAHPKATPEMVACFEQTVPAAERDRCRSMRGHDLTEQTGPAHLLFEHATSLFPRVVTIGIGDGGNEIGMGKIPWETIHRNVPQGGLIACRVPTDHLIVAGVSNWGAYALAAGVRFLRGAAHDPSLFDLSRERALLEIMVARGPLVDGTTGQAVAQVDGLPFHQYAGVLRGLEKILTS